MQTSSCYRKPCAVDANIELSKQARYYTKVDALAKELLKAVMVRPLPLKDLDPRLHF